MNAIALLPSLDRPHLVKRFFECYKETKGSIPGIVIVDKQDPQKEAYTKLEYPKGWHLVFTEAVKMGDKFRETYAQYKDKDAVMILNDDHEPITEGWDVKILSQINGTNVVSCNDGPEPSKPWNAPNRICGAICFSGKVIRALGYLFPKDLNHLYSDDVWGFLFSRSGNVQVLMDVCVHHNHAYKDKSKRDKTYLLINGDGDFTGTQPTGGMWLDDRAAFDRWFKEDAEKDAQKILDLQPKQGLMIATPSHDGNCNLGYALGLTDLAVFLASHGVHFEMARVVGSSLIPHARNSLVDMFLKSKCQKLLFVDSDQGWTKEAALILFQSNRRIIAGVTPHKRFPINLNFEPLAEDAYYFKDQNNKGSEEFTVYAKEKASPLGEIEVNRTGTGFMMIDRSVFDIMKDKVDHYMPFDNRTDVKHGEFFKMGSGVNLKGETRFHGEDWIFTSLAKELKIPIFINARALVSHHGSFNYEVGMTSA